MLPQIRPLDIVANGCRLGGSLTGSKKEATEMLVSLLGAPISGIASLTVIVSQQLAVNKNIKPWVEVFPMSKIKEAVEGMRAGKPKYRYVLKQDLA
jgi:alcohol dehydrogenase (NADP+)